MRTSVSPIEFDVVTVPPQFDRAQVALRLLLMVVLAHVGTTLGWLFWFLYLALPVVAAILISQHGSAGYVSEDAPAITKLLRWVVAVYAYLLLLTDRFPMTMNDPAIHFDVYPQGVPTVGSALLRLITTLPLALAMALLGFISTLIWIVAMAWVLVSKRYPKGLYDFQIGVVRWLARLWGYHASLMQTYPPVSFEPGRAVPIG